MAQRKKNVGTNAYESFLAGKVVAAPDVGFDPAQPIAENLFGFQRDIVAWALRKGRAAIFADCGMGKTLMELEWSKHVQAKTGGRVLILAPLAVASQTVLEGEKFGIPVRQVREPKDVTGPGIYVTNYERLDKFDAALFDGVVLDESSILKAFMGKTKRSLVASFAKTPYRLACTATPAPNDPMELGNHSEFLGVMSSHKMLARWFVNDTSQAGVWRLKGHAARDYWRWVCSWAVCITKPSDLGHDDAGYVLPPLELVQHTASVDITDGRDEGKLFRDPSLNATALHKELRRTAPERAARVAELVNGTPGQWVVWCNTNYEADDLTRLIEGAVEVRGNDSIEKKERAIADFLSGATRVLISKPSIFGYGLNLQHVSQMAFVGLSYSYEDLYQALRRCYRFGQKNTVYAHIVAAETEGEIVATVRAKQEEHLRMQEAMVAAMREHGLAATKALVTALAYTPHKETGRGWEVWNGDCVEMIRHVPDEHAGLVVYSPPFSNLYTYSDSYRDMGNSENDDEFFRHFAFLLPELLRVTKTGRLMCVHVKQVVDYRGRDGRAGLRDFRGDVIRACEAAGWKYHSEVCIWKCPVTEMQRTKSHGLLYKQLRADSSHSRMGLAEYVCVFRKWGAENEPGDAPVTHTTDDFPLDMWQRYASPVWTDIDQTNVLNVKVARENADEKHMAPLQLDVIERCVRLWSNPGDVVLSPFTGIGSEGYMALKMGRQFWGSELKESYFQQACRNLREVEGDRGQQSLFGDDEDAGAAA